MASLTIAPIWDEVMAMEMVNRSDNLSRLIYRLWLDPFMTLYRPLSASILAIVLAITPFDVAWRLLRLINAGLLLLSFYWLAISARLFAVPCRA